uniref:Uncharacterized protein n=1 Tax=Caenorhabditis japonica TaxID=281687 RepID=A0A8R1HRN9_CAEJA
MVNFSTVAPIVVSSLTPVMRYAKKLIILDEDSQLTVTTYRYYPLWFFIVMTIGITFCTVSCGIWFICAIFRLKQDKPCNHAAYSTHIVMDANGEHGLQSEAAKHSKKLEALSEAESMAKSFKSIRSKLTSKSKSSAQDTSKKAIHSSKSKKESSKKVSMSQKSKKGSKEEKMSAESATRNEGGKNTTCVIQMTPPENVNAAKMNRYFTPNYFPSDTRSNF